ncbi:MAG TPA: hypothetical protein VNN25_24670, partial [Thermoanaerobaculia bacterium]|nr:hypothetical protein [Thermoanaerobaculia bacterium]
MPDDLATIKRKQYNAHLAVMALRRTIFERGASARIDELIKAEERLAQLSEERARAEKQSLAANASQAGGKLLGGATTGLDAKAELRLEYVPTALVHLFDS